MASVWLLGIGDYEYDLLGVFSTEADALAAAAELGLPPDAVMEQSLNPSAAEVRQSFPDLERRAASYWPDRTS